MKMMQLAIRGIRASLGRLALTIVAIAAGVGFVAGAFILADSLQTMFTTLLESSTSDVDAQVAVAELEFGQDKRTLPDTIVAELEALPETGKVTPGVTIDPAQGGLQPFVVLDDRGQPVEPKQGSIMTFSLWDDSESEAVTTAEGVPPVGIDQVAIDTNYAAAAGVAVGDRLTLSTPDGERQFELAGIVDAPITAGAYLVLFDFPTAQSLYGKDGLVDTIALSRAPGFSTDELIAAVERVTPEQAAVSSQEQVIDKGNAEFEKLIGIFRSLLLGFAGVALFVSLFIIYNTFAILVTQRLHQIGMLRAIGATRGQIRVSVIFEALLVGLMGSGLGLAFGLVVAFLIRKALQATAGFPEAAMIVAPRTIVVAMSVGLVATVASALLPSVLAGRVSPIAAMRNEGPSRSSAARRVAIGGVVTAVGLVVLALGLFGGGQTTITLISELAIGVVLTFIGVALLSVLFAGPVVNTLGRPPVLGLCLTGLGAALPVLSFTVGDGAGGITFMAKLLVSGLAVVTGVSVLVSWLRGKPLGPGGSAAGLAGRLARQNAARSPRRTAATATALTIGIALVATVGVVGQSFKASFADTLDRAVKAELFVYDAAAELPFSGEVANRLETVDGLASVTRIRFNEIRVGSDIETVTAYEAATGESLVDFHVTQGSTDGLVDGGVLVLAATAEQRALIVGDTVTVDFPDSETEELVVAGIFTDNIFDSPWVIDLGLYERHVGDDSDAFVAASIAEGADPARVKADAVAAIAEFSSVSVEDAGEFLRTQEGQVDQLITLINALLGFALFVAFLGVVNTIVLSVVERTREIGLLRAVGTSRQQIRATIRWESVIVCLFGAGLGIVLGVLFAWAAVAAIPDDVIATIAIPYESVLFAVLVAAMAGVIAAVLPARRAANLNVLDAIAGDGR